MSGLIVLSLFFAVLACIVACAFVAGAPRPNGEAEQRQMDLTEAQRALSASMRQSGKHLLSGKEYIPETITIKTPVRKPANVTQLRRAKP